MHCDSSNRLKVFRGSQLPQSKLTEGDVALIWEVVAERDRLKKQLAQMTNAAIAEKFGVSVQTIDKITAGESWVHVRRTK